MGFDKIASRAENTFTNPLLGAFTSVIGVIVGVIGSLYPEIIKNTFFSFCIERQCITSKDTFISAVFWISVSGFGLFFWGIQGAQMKRSTQVTNELKNKSEELQGLVTRLLTLPPEGFLGKFQGLFRPALAISLAAILEESVTREQIECAIRFVLGSLAALAKAFDGDPSNSVFNANIMVFRSKEDLMPNPAEKQRIESIIIFSDEFNSIDFYQGVLELIPEFSTTSEAKGYEIDSSICAIALPIPIIKDVTIYGQRKHKVLPGAPWSFVHNTYSCFHTIKEFTDWCHDHCDFTDTVKIAIKDYFESGSGVEVKSFASLPILPATPEIKASQKPLAVLNIHRNAEGILTGRGKLNDSTELGMQLFTPLTEPFRLLLALLLEKHSLI